VAESFEREFKGLQKFEPVSRTHEGLVDILTLGLLPGGEGFYYVMELADRAGITPDDASAEVRKCSASHSKPGLEFADAGCYVPRTLRADLKQYGALPADEVIALGLRLTAALAHLHDNGLVHRDVKPSNILFIDGEAKLADAGLVADADDARSLVGTVGYIAPEGPGTPQGDLYALGKVLYEAAFGKDRHEFPTLPPDIRTRPDHTKLLELNAILLKASATDRHQRYQSADQMHADLKLMQAGSSVRSRHARQRVLSLVQKPLAVAVVAAVFVMVFSFAARSPRSSSFKPSRITEANDAYKRGINELHLNLNAAEAIRHFERATQLDPKFADAFAQLAAAWYSVPGEASSKKGQQAAEKAVMLDPHSGLARAEFAAAKLFSLDLHLAEVETKLAIKLAPDSEQVLLVAALNFAALGRTNEALSNLKRAHEVGWDTPSKLRIIYSGFVYGWCRDFDRAIAIYDAAPWLKDDVDKPHYMQSVFYLAEGDYETSIRLGRQSALERGVDPTEVSAEFDALESAFRQNGPEGYWQQRLKIDSSKAGDHHYMNMAAIHARLNQTDQAIEYLRRAKETTPATFAIEINTNASFDGLRDEWRFRELMAELWRQK
jgi:tetratricopeptide (TPR) repeat protein